MWAARVLPGGPLGADPPSSPGRPFLREVQRGGRAEQLDRPAIVRPRRLDLLGEVAAGEASALEADPCHPFPATPAVTDTSEPGGDAVALAPVVQVLLLRADVTILSAPVPRERERMKPQITPPGLRPEPRLPRAKLAKSAKKIRPDRLLSLGDLCVLGIPRPIDIAMSSLHRRGPSPPAGNYYLWRDSIIGIECVGVAPVPPKNLLTGSPDRVQENIISRMPPKSTGLWAGGSRAPGSRDKCGALIRVQSQRRQCYVLRWTHDRSDQSEAEGTLFRLSPTGSERG